MVSATASLAGVSAACAQQVKWSAGTASPKTKLPDGAIDCHHHIYDARYPVDPKATLRPADALIEDYRGLKQRLGISRHVIVQPSTYGLDNRGLLDALQAFGPTSRGIAVINDQVPSDDLKRMHSLGVRGVRFNLNFPGGAPVEIMAPLSKRIAELGWHVQIVAGPARLIEHAELLNSLPTQVVFDHLGQVPSPDHAAFAVVDRLLQKSKAWVKVSCMYTFSKAPELSDAIAVARAYVATSPARVVWGTDWPHPTAPESGKPDDAQMVDIVSDLAGSAALRQKIFVDNPVELYGF